MRRFLTYFLAAIVSALGASAAEDAAKNYLLMPVTTELQRRELVGPGVTAYAAINGSALVQGGTIDAQAINWETFRRELSALAKERPGSVKINLLFATGQSERAAADLVDAALTQIGRRAGFGGTQIASTYHPSAWRWQEHLESFAGPGDGQENSQEDPVHDARVRAYPVRTRLSRWLTASADAVVMVRQPFDGRTPGLPTETVDSIRRLVGQLQIPDKGKLMVCVDSTAAGKFAVDRFVEGGAKELAQSLGFVSSTVRHSPNSGAPESLLDKPAPDFTLRGLDGKELNLREATGGRVALVTFWGVACGPCQQEAPHLSALYQQHSGAGFTVIAVNAYDEPRETVARFVEQARLSHPIVLMGKQVAQEKYAVGAYPTSFWIDHHGKIVEYVVGFESGDEALIAAKIRKLLNQRDEP